MLLCENPSASLKTIKEGLSKANEFMQMMTNHQVMAMAPPKICEQYLSEVFNFIHAQARNKRLHLQMENKDLAMRTRKLKEDRKLEEDRKSCNDDDLKMLAVESDVEKQ